MKGRLKQLTGVFLALLLCVSLAAPAAAANPGVNEISSAALDLISSHEGTYSSVHANDSGAVSIGKIQWHGERAHGVARLAAQYMGADGTIAILGQSFYNEIMSSVNWDSRSVTSAEAAALSKLMDSSAGRRAQDEQGTKDLSAYVKSGQSIGLADPCTLVYYCDLYNQWPVKAMEIARTTVSNSGINASVPAIHQTAMASAMGSGGYNETLRNGAYNFCTNINWSKYIGITGTPNPTKFVDVPAGAYYTKAVIWAVDNGIAKGTSSNCFSPDAPCTRAEAVTFLWRAMGSLKPTTTVTIFDDVSTKDFYYKAVMWAYEQGITSGTAARTFSPDQKCTRGEIVTFLWRAAGMPAAGASGFTDVPAKSYCSTAVGWAAARGVTKGDTATTFAPDGVCTRGQIVTFLYRDQA